MGKWFDDKYRIKRVSGGRIKKVHVVKKEVTADMVNAAYTEFHASKDPEDLDAARRLEEEWIRQHQRRWITSGLVKNPVQKGYQTGYGD